MKIVVLDGYTENPGDLSWGGLEQLGDVTVYDRTSYTESPLIAERIGDAEIVVMNKTPISRATLDKCPNIKLIAVLATGYNVVDIAYAKEKGIPVCNVPNYGGYSVSQFAIALMLEACLHIGHHNQTVHDGKWQNGNEWCYWDYPLIELAGKTYGLLGCGKIGYHTAEAAKGLGMHVIAYDKYPSQAARDLGVEFVELDDLFARSDVLGLQMPLMEFNTGIIRKENIAKMKDGVIIINNSRGQMVVEQDLADALNSGKVAFAGLDVVSTEPIRADNPLLKAKNCIITPHMSWGSQGSRQRIMDSGERQGFPRRQPGQRCQPVKGACRYGIPSFRVGLCDSHSKGRGNPRRAPSGLHTGKYCAGLRQWDRRGERRDARRVQ